MLYFSRWKAILIWLATALSILVAIPNFLPKATLDALPSWVPKKTMTLGLDLQGGSHIMLKLERGDIVKERMQTALDDVRTNLRKAGIGYTGLNGSGQKLTFKLRDVTQIDAARDALKDLTALVSLGGLSGGSIQEATLSNTDDGAFELDLTDQGINYRVQSAVSQSIEVVRRRVDELGTTEPLIQRQGSDRIIVQVPGLDDPQRLKAILNQTAKLTFHLVDNSMPAVDAVNGRPPANSEVVYSNDDPPVPYLIQKTAILSGENLVDAQPGFNQQNSEPIVSFRFDSAGAQKFGRVTQEHVGEPFAVILDNQVITAPVINEPILGGQGQISGNFTVESANDLAVLLRAGALPATLTVVEERTVGPGLGADSIRAGFIAGVIGLIAVIAFMTFFYGTLGMIANLAMIINVLMIIAILSLLGATLTLPGIAGIVLTIGQAVDSNVLFYERFREEVKAGRSIPQAMEAGFNKAFGTIIDANLTTLIAAVILFYMGSGPVRGFAITLSIGIITTVFTAYTVSRLMIAIWMRRTRPKALPKGVRTGFFDFAQIRFMAIRNYTFAISAALTIGAIAGFATLGLNLGIDFTGGSIIELKAKQGDANIGDIRERLGTLNLGGLQVQGFGEPSNVLVRVQSQEAGENAEQSAVNKIRGELSEQYEFRRVEVVGPSVSGELAMTGIIGVGLSLIAIMGYIWVRFEWQFAIGAIIATLHDLLLTIGLFVFTGLEFDITSIAAVLTIVGYSLNDTVVVYDRLRENLRRYKKMPLPLLIDTSINSTLSRTILTSVTTMIAILALVVFGGDVIRGFTISMLFGVVVGTFSSIYIAAPVLILFKLRPDTFDKDKDNKATAEIQSPAV
ncbi:protein translocase subunit SecDF [Rhizobium sp. KVB221]|uniref:Multifunctional fusion protein n=1 Tax=Rhizobium setariae TaxID=2801340 RepID=A0A936YQK2_9HYPH|nr:protein translocase subunit SecDF [Rhizobium setariae]MBL0374878.1 protein translocase subunit SecDF [Rhizobium setariae]